jgi:hypothetical protein
MNHQYDVIIIGAGLSGLYSAYQIKKMDPHCKYLILESNRRPFIGGRVGNSHFYGAEVVIGAGVGRRDTDKVLIALLNELHIEYKPFLANMYYSSQIDKPINVKKYLYELRAAYKRDVPKHPLTFKAFAKGYLGDAMYKKFLVSAGYTDYEKEDAYEVLYHYQMDDNAPGWTGLEIHWSTLIHKLSSKVGYNNIKTSSKVTSITPIKNKDKNCMFSVLTEKNVEYFAHKVIVATRISTTQQLLPQFSIYKQIHGQPFLYVYAKFNKESAQVMRFLVPDYTIVPGPLQKMIPMDADRGVYMIAYSDNKSAEYLRPFTANTEKNREFFEAEIEKAFGLKNGILKIIALTDFYWPIGTHYYEPLDTSKFKNREEFIRKAQHPEKGILVVGEAVSRRQGWTEGALESVHAVLNKDWLLSRC